MSLLLARFGSPLVVRFPLFFRGISRQSGLTGLIEGEAIREPERFGLALANTGAAHERIKAHNSLPSTISFRDCLQAEGLADNSVRATLAHRTPLGYIKILLASPVCSRVMALEKSFIGIRSVITGCRSSLPALSNAVI